MLKKTLYLLIIVLIFPLFFIACDASGTQYFGALNFIDVQNNVFYFTALFDSEDSQAARLEFNVFMAELEAQINTKIPTSQISIFNNSVGEQQPFEIGVHFYNLFVMSQEINGQLPDFNPSLLPIIKCWRLDNFDNEEDVHIPSQYEFETILPLCDMNNFEVENRGSEGYFITKKQGFGGAMLDFGAIAKGYACDKVIEIAKTFEIEKIWLNYGGNVGFLSTYSTTNIAIRHPFQYGKIINAKTSLSQAGVVTSGTYERYKTKDGEIYHHILNRNGMHSGDFASVSVVHASGAYADAITTALLSQTVADAKRIIAEMGLKAILINKSGEVVFNNV